MMKKILIPILMVLAVHLGYSQAPAVFLGEINKGVKARSSLWADSALYLGVMDTNFIPIRAGAIVFKSSDKKFYGWDGTWWVNLGGTAGGGAGHPVDTMFNLLRVTHIGNVTDIPITVTSNLRIWRGLFNSPFDVGIGAEAANSTTGNAGIVAAGYQAAKNSTSGGYITALGYRSFLNNVIGGYSTAVGGDALLNSIGTGGNTATGAWAMRGLAGLFTGTGNTGIGVQVLDSLTTGGNNAGLGYWTLLSNRSGSDNTANGTTAMRYNVSGNANSAVGRYTLWSNVSGSYNTGMGARSLYNALGDGNVALGYEAGFNETGSNKLYIDNSSTSTPLIWGDFASDFLKFYAKVSIVDGTQGAGKVFTSDAAGNGSWQTISAGGGTDATTASEGLTKVGDDIRFGGTFTSDRTITAGANTVWWSGNGSRVLDISTTHTAGGAAINVHGGFTGFSTGIYVEAPTTGSIGVNSWSSSGIAVQGVGSLFVGVLGSSTTGYGGKFTAGSSNGSVIVPAMLISNNLSVAGANGGGVSADFAARATDNSYPLTNRLISRLIDATPATLTTHFDISGVKSGTSELYANFQPNGIVRVNSVTGTLIDTLATRAYARSFGGGGGGGSASDTSKWRTITGGIEQKGTGFTKMNEARIQGSNPYNTFYNGSGTRIGWFGHGVGDGNIYITNEYVSGRIVFAPAGWGSTGVDITNAGRMLIGTTTDDGINKLQVNGNASVTGSANVGYILNTTGAGPNWGIMNGNLEYGDWSLMRSNSNGGNPLTAGSAVIYSSAAKNIGLNTTAATIGDGTYQSHLVSLRDGVSGAYVVLRKPDALNFNQGVYIQDKSLNAGWVLGVNDVGYAIIGHGSGANETNAVSSARTGNQFAINPSTGNLMLGNIADDGVNKLRINGYGIATGWKVNGGVGQKILLDNGTTIAIDSFAKKSAIDTANVGIGLTWDSVTNIIALDTAFVRDMIDEGGGGGSGADLLPLNNRWTGTQQYNNANMHLGFPESDEGILSVEQLGSAGWGLGTGWAGTFGTGFTHTSGAGTAPLTNTLTGTSNAAYLLSYTVAGRTTGSFTITHSSVTGTTAITATGSTAILGTGSGTYSIVPSTDFNGTINPSVKNVNTSTPNIVYRSSDSVIRNEIRIPKALGSAYNGISNGRRSLSTAVDNTVTGYTSFQYNVLGLNNTVYGNYSLSASTAVNNNVTVGNNVFGPLIGGGSNTGVGASAGENMTGGLENTIMGFRGARRLPDGSTNVTSMDFSTMVGSNTSPLGNGQTNQNAFGYNAKGLGSNTSVMGNSNTTLTGFWGDVKLLGTTRTLQLSHVLTAVGTTGAQTINNPKGKVNFAAAATTLVVTNSLVSTSSHVQVQVEGSDATAKSATVTLAAGSFTITLNQAATAETRVSFFVINGY